jgi:hypothetical protein
MHFLFLDIFELDSNIRPIKIRTSLRTCSYFGVLRVAEQFVLSRVGGHKILLHVNTVHKTFFAYLIMFCELNAIKQRGETRF